VNTSTTALVVSAPGKLMIAGEYAVLEGAEAVVSAVGRRAYARLAAGPQPPLSPEAQAARTAAERRVGPVTGAITLDIGELQQEGRKLGLGSSAASAAAAAGVVFAAHGHDVATADTREQVLAAALEGHRAVAPHGSGADVAAAVLGGFVRFRKLGDGVETHALRWPEALELVVVWHGTPVRTSDMLTQVRNLAAHQPDVYRTRMRELAAQSEQLVSALLASELDTVVDCFHSYGTAMGALGEAAGICVITDTCEQLRSLARAQGGAAKPSGAGGGDVTIAAFSSASAAAEFRARCASAGFEVLSLELGAHGERDEEPW
jgi:phosphomevalonate kinase